MSIEQLFDHVPELASGLEGCMGATWRSTNPWRSLTDSGVSAIAWAGMREKHS